MLRKNSDSNADAKNSNNQENISYNDFDEHEIFYQSQHITVNMLKNQKKLTQDYVSVYCVTDSRVFNSQKSRYSRN